MIIQDVIEYFNTHYPSHLAYDWDNVGLQIGSTNEPITGIHIALDLTLEVIEEAKTHGANLIITHHPFLFKSLSRIDYESYEGRIIKALIDHNFTVYAAHTNYDIGSNGMNKVLADKLGLKNQRPLEMITEDEGIGVIGTIKKRTLREFIVHVKDSFDLTTVRLISNKKHVDVETVAILGGSGADSDLRHAYQENVDIYLTGDISYHQAHDMLHLDLTAIDIGHATEHHFAAGLKKELGAAFDTQITISAVDFDPFNLM
ncbi:MAG: Nif3-like dinuclear metal center hexameric protein [Bacillota bacterium]